MVGGKRAMGPLAAFVHSAILSGLAPYPPGDGPCAGAASSAHLTRAAAALALFVLSFCVLHAGLRDALRP